MTCQQARQISIVDFLKHLNINPGRIRGKEYWYLSPFRQENTASFKVDTDRNLFYDHGNGVGGDIIDLGCQLLKCDVKELLSKLESDSFLFHQQPDVIGNIRILDSVLTESDVSPVVIKYTQAVGNSAAITDYVNSRGIPIDIAKQFCEEVYYQIRDRNYFAIGFKNQSGGYELRSQYFKGSSSPKDITHLQNGNQSVCVLEGFMDFLSLLTLRKQSPIRSDFLILNSVSFVDRSIEMLKNYRDVFLYLDHDNAGRKALTIYQQANLNIIDASGSYHQFKDLNEYLLDQQSTKLEEKQSRHLKRSRGHSL